MSGVRERRLLVLCYFFPPLAGGGVHRILGFTRHLPAHGWSTTVVCAGPDDYWVTDPSLEARVHPATEVVRVRGGSGLSAWLSLRGGAKGAGRRSGAAFGPLRRLSDLLLLPDSYAPWARRAARAALRLARGGRFDALLSSSPPDSVHLAALRVARATRLPWVADFRDPWIGLHFREPPTAWHRARHARMERDVLEGADLVLAASRSHADTLGARSGATPRRAVHLPNGFEPAAPAPDPPDPGEPHSFTMVFTGTLSQMSDTEQFLDALHDVLAHRAEARRRIRVHLCGPFDVHYENRAVALGLSGIVRFPGPLDHADTRRLQREADLLLLWKPRHGTTMVPGKTYEYLDAGRPVLALLNPTDEAADLVRRAGGRIVDPDDRAAIAGAIAERYDAWKAHGRAPDARPDWLAGFTRESLTARLASELDSLVQSRA